MKRINYKTMDNALWEVILLLDIAIQFSSKLPLHTLEQLANLITLFLYKYKGVNEQLYLQECKDKIIADINMREVLRQDDISLVFMGKINKKIHLLSSYNIKKAINAGKEILLDAPPEMQVEGIKQMVTRLEEVLNQREE